MIGNLSLLSLKTISHNLDIVSQLDCDDTPLGKFTAFILKHQIQKKITTLSFIKKAFGIYELLAAKSIGDCCISTSEIGDLGFTCFVPTFANMYRIQFHETKENSKFYYDTVFKKCNFEEMHIYRICDTENSCSILLSEIFSLDHKEVELVLIFFGYLDDSEKFKSSLKLFKNLPEPLENTTIESLAKYFVWKYFEFPGSKLIKIC
jgi:hypothetical protein